MAEEKENATRAKRNNRRPHAKGGNDAKPSNAPSRQDAAQKNAAQNKPKAKQGAQNGKKNAQTKQSTQNEKKNAQGKQKPAAPKEERVLQNAPKKNAPKAKKNAAYPAEKNTKKSVGSEGYAKVETAKNASPSHTSKQKVKAKPVGKLRVFSLGGLNEIGKNMTVFEYENDIIIVDCGLGFPDEDMLGIDLVIPDITYLKNNVQKVRGIFLTHGHEDHIGALPYILRDLHVPVFGTRLTLGILENKLAEVGLLETARLNTVEAGSKVTAGAFSVEFIHVNHSIADACALAIRTPLGTVLHTGDFKIDVSPIDGDIMDLTRLGELGREGVLLLMCESTNAERAGHTPSERKIGQSFDQIFMANPTKRLIIATFSSNVHRVQQIINASIKYGRKVAVTGRSMVNVVDAAVRLGYMNVPEGVLIDISEIRRYKPEQITIVTTGSQGEPMSSLYRMAFSEHNNVELNSGDLVVLSSSAIPGNEPLVGKIINELYRRGVNVYHDPTVSVHVSGHACQEELKLVHALTKPKYFMPIHGEYRHLVVHKELAEFMGMESRNIFVSEIGKVLEIDADGARFAGSVPAGNVLVDGYGVGDVGNIVLRDRKHLSEDGLIVVVASVDIQDGLLISGPDIVSRGFVYVREAEDLMNTLRDVAKKAISDDLYDGVTEWNQLKTDVKDAMSKFLYAKTKRKPMILPVIMNV